MWLLQGAVRRELERASRENGQLQQALVRGLPAQHSGRVFVGSSSCLCLPVDVPEVPRQLTAAWLAAAQDQTQSLIKTTIGRVQGSMGHDQAMIQQQRQALDTAAQNAERQAQVQPPPPYRVAVPRDLHPLRPNRAPTTAATSPGSSRRHLRRLPASSSTSPLGCSMRWRLAWSSCMGLYSLSLSL
eukprot:SAG25_NODE_6004_length_597_cov_1.120482_1_plen_185_part_01